MSTVFDSKDKQITTKELCTMFVDNTEQVYFLYIGWYSITLYLYLPDGMKQFIGNIWITI